MTVDVTENIPSRSRDRTLDIPEVSSKTNPLNDSSNSGESGSSCPENGHCFQDSIMECDKVVAEDETDSPVYNKTTEPIKDPSRFPKPSRWYIVRKTREHIQSIRDSVADFSRRQWFTLIALCIGTLTSSLSVCLFPPFFPKLAESKGESATMYGIVIGTNCLTAFLVTPFIGKKLHVIGVNFLFVVGVMGSGACCCLSGFLEYFPPGWKFLVLAIAIRILHATANAGVITTNMAFIASEFPNSVPFLFSLTRATMNLAQMFGPVIGGALHTVGGFKMPFFVLGGFQIIMTPVCAIMLPKFAVAKQRSKKNLWSILKVPGLWVSFTTFIFSTMSNGFLSITLEPRVLRPLKMSALWVGILFGMKDGANCFASPIWGWMCEKTSKNKCLIILGSVMAAVSFILLGPFPGIPITQSMGVVVVALLLNGAGVGGQQVAGVASAIEDAAYEGFPNEAETHAFIASLWSSFSGAGRFLSRTVSGVLVDHIGFRSTSSIVTCLHLAVIIICVIHVIVRLRLKKTELPLIIENKIEDDFPKESSPNMKIPGIATDLEDSLHVGSAHSICSKRKFSSLGNVQETLS